MAVKKTPSTAAKTAVPAAAKTVAKAVPAATKAAPAKAAPVKAVKAAKAAVQGYDDLAVLGQDNFEALVKSNTLFAKGVETIGKEVFAFAQRSVEENMAQVQALIGAQSLQEILDLQSGFAKQRMEETLAETAKLTELSAQVANEAIEPLQKRVDVAVEKVLKARAA